MLKTNYKLHKIKGDASFREFYRKKKNQKAVLLFSQKKKKEKTY